MGKKGLAVLQDLIHHGYVQMIDKVVVAHDPNIQKDYYEEIVEVCSKSNIDFYDRKCNIAIRSPYCIAIAWRWMIPLSDASKLIVFHDSLLPKYRGFAPLVNMLINFERKIGVTALYASEEYDKGDIIAQKEIEITYPIRISDAIDSIIPIYSALACEIFESVQYDKMLTATPQDEAQSSYSLWRNEDDYRIDWQLSSAEIRQFVYSVGFPYKGASTMMDAEKLRIFDCELYDDVLIENRTPGKLIFVDGGCPVIVCGKGLLKLTDVRDERGNLVLPLKRFRVKLK